MRSLVAQCCSEAKRPGKVNPLPSAERGDKGKRNMKHKERRDDRLSRNVGKELPPYTL
jgi:hypothetical protein